MEKRGKVKIWSGLIDAGHFIMFLLFLIEDLENGISVSQTF